MVLRRGNEKNTFKQLKTQIFVHNLNRDPNKYKQKHRKPVRVPPRYVPFVLEFHGSLKAGTGVGRYSGACKDVTHIVGVVYAK